VGGTIFLSNWHEEGGNAERRAFDESRSYQPRTSQFVLSPKIEHIIKTYFEGLNK
jgi:hypothetical protein